MKTLKALNERAKKVGLKVDVPHTGADTWLRLTPNVRFFQGEYWLFNLSIDYVPTLDLAIAIAWAAVDAIAESKSIDLDKEV